LVADRTLVSELATGLGMLPAEDLSSALASRSPVLAVDDGTWSRLDYLYRTGRYRHDFVTAYRNGQVFASALDGLRGRPPRLIEWTGRRRPSGDEVAPIDLRVDHVYLVSCKYLSANLANASPARLFEGLLATSGDWDRTDWYQLVAPDEYQALYLACRSACELADLPESSAELSGPDRARLRSSLGGTRFPSKARAAYRQLCAAVSSESARRWNAGVEKLGGERMLWRLLRIGNAPYFLLGAHQNSSLRLRIDTAWDWHQLYQLQSFTISAPRAGQPRVGFTGRCAERATGGRFDVSGHVEIRWSHGRFGQPPEAKVYLDTPIDNVPGYHGLEMIDELRQTPLPGLEGLGAVED
jgi:hypothetical protein